MRWIIRGLLLVVSLIIILFGVQMVASESGEVVVLETTTAAGKSRETRLWLVEHDGSQWLRAGHAGAGWYQELLAVPEVQVTRAEQTRRYRAVPTVDERSAVNTAMNVKYRWADDFIGFLFGRDDAIPIRMEPSAG